MQLASSHWTTACHYSSSAELRLQYALVDCVLCCAVLCCTKNSRRHYHPSQVRLLSSLLKNGSCRRDNQAKNRKYFPVRTTTASLESRFGKHEPSLVLVGRPPWTNPGVILEDRRQFSGKTYAGEDLWLEHRALQGRSYSLRRPGTISKSHVISQRFILARTTTFPCKDDIKGHVTCETRISLMLIYLLNLH